MENINFASLEVKYENYVKPVDFDPFRKIMSDDVTHFFLFFFLLTSAKLTTCLSQ